MVTLVVKVYPDIVVDSELCADGVVDAERVKAGVRLRDILEVFHVAVYCHPAVLGGGG